MEEFERVRRLFQKSGSDLDSESGRDLQSSYPGRSSLIYKLAMDVNMSCLMRANILVASKSPQ
jgi:hypothetical protein